MRLFRDLEQPVVFLKGVGAVRGKSHTRRASSFCRGGEEEFVTECPEDRPSRVLKNHAFTLRQAQGERGKRASRGL